MIDNKSPYKGIYKDGHQLVPDALSDDYKLRQLEATRTAYQWKGASIYAWDYKKDGVRGEIYDVERIGKEMRGLSGI